MSLDPFANVLQPVLEARPAHWQVGRFGVEFTESDERNGSEPIGPMLSVSSARGVEVQASDAAQRPSADVAHYRVVRPGQLAANMMWLNFGGLGVSRIAGYISPAYKAFWVSDRMDAAFVHHLLRSNVYVETFASLGQGVRPNSQMVTSALLSMMPILIPPLDEQRRLAGFLDRELAEIDAMDAELNHLIQTLQERRSVSIESVLANPGRRTKLGYFVETLAGYAFPANRFSRDDRDTRLLRGVNVKPRGTDWADTVYWPTEQTAGLDRYVLEPGDVVLGMDRPFVGGGTRVVSLTEDDLPALLLQRVLRLRPLPDGSPEFLRLLLMTKEFEHYATPETTGISVPHISESQVLDFPVTVPPADEQRQLAQQVLSELDAVNEMIAGATRLKALLAERRSTLITDVVTGKKEVPA